MPDPTPHLHQISTHWSMIFQAHASADPAAPDARANLLLRYGAAVYHFLLGKVHDPEAADELCQEFALRLVRGDFHRAHPDRGHFRALLQAALTNLVTDYHRRRQVRHQPLPPDSPLLADLEAPADSAGTDFARHWRDEMLAQAWEGLARHQDEHGGMQYAVLRGRADHPDLSSTALAEVLADRLGQPLRAEAVRQTLRRARETFADLLRAEVARSLETDEPAAVEQELADLGLLTYCRPA
jgi:RNA polymerase sigma factor (sigma-70 family)